MNKIYKIKHSALRGTSVVVSELKTNRTKGLKQRVTPLLVTVAKATAAIVMGGALATSVWADDTTVPNTGKVPSSAGVYMQTYPKESTDGKNYPAFEAEVSQLFYGQAGIGKLSTFKDPSRWFTVF